MDSEELQKTLKSHALWVGSNGEKGGRANLSGADLLRADLLRADLNGCIGNMREVRSMQLDTWPITWYGNTLQIGCQRHTFDDWRDFSDERISTMDSKALEWWWKWRDAIFQVIKLSEG